MNYPYKQVIPPKHWSGPKFKRAYRYDVLFNGRVKVRRNANKS